MANKSKKYTQAVAKIDRTKLYDSKEALDLVAEIASAKFDETVEAHIKLGVDGRHADQQVRGAIVIYIHLVLFSIFLDVKPCVFRCQPMYHSFKKHFRKFTDSLQKNTPL